MRVRRNFTSWAEAAVLDALREIAAREGRRFEDVLGEALREYVSRKRQPAHRDVRAAFHQSLQERDDLYWLLANA